MHKIDLYSNSIISVSAILALIMLLLVLQPMSLYNTTCIHVIPCWWSHSSCNAYQMHSMTFQTVRWFISCIYYVLVIHSFVTHHAGLNSYYTPQL